MRIRKFHKDDTEQIIKIWGECGLLHPPNDPYLEIRTKANFQPDLFFVGEIDGRVMATIMVGFEGRRGWLNLLGVLPEYQGQGYGSELVRHAVEVLRKIGAPKVNLLVRPSNSKVQAFYEKLGFEFEDAILMSHRFKKQ